MVRYNPFNPQQPARPEFFVGRTEELNKFEQNILQTIHDSPMNMSINGNRGTGKTSVLVKMEEIAKKNNCLVFRMSNYEGSVKNIPDLIEYLVIGIKREFFSDAEVLGKLNDIGEWVKTLKPHISYKDVDLSFEEKEIAAQTILRDNLSKIWNKVKGKYSAIVLLIDEAESLERIEGVLSFLREILQRLSTESRYSVVLSGKLNFPQRMSESFSPLNRFFPTHCLSVLSEEEVSQYIKKKMDSVGVTIDEDVVKNMYLKSEGHPYVVVSIAAEIFSKLKDNETRLTKEHFESGFPQAVASLEKDFFLSAFHPLSPKARKKIVIIAKQLGKIEFHYKEASALFPGKEKNDLGAYIQEAVRKGVLNKPERAHYIFFHGLFLQYLKEQADIY